MPEKITRRVVLGAGAASAGVALANASMIAGAGAQTPVRIRHSIATPQGKQMLALYRKAIGRMMAKPRYHPHNWYYQANIHAYPEGSNEPDLSAEERVAAVFNQSQGSTPAVRELIAKYRLLALGTQTQHGVWHSCSHFHGGFVAGEGDRRERHFLTWHRIYLHYLEEAIRSVLDAGDPPFAMPYWDYGHKDQQGRLDQLRIPAEFVQERLPDGQANHLYFKERNKDALDLGIPPRDVDTRVIFQQGQLLTGGSLSDGFNGRINSRPHGAIHGIIGTPKGMGSFEYAGRDPLFWLHHANIDRLWESWRQPTPAGASARDPSTAAWLAQAFAFPDAKAERTTMKVSDAVNLSKTAIRYDRLDEASLLLAASPEPPAGQRTTLSESSPQAQPQITEKNIPVDVTVPPTASPTTVMGFRNRTNARYFLVIDVETTTASGGVYEVYARLPSGSGTTEHFLESFDLFGPRGGGKRTVTWTADVTAFVRQNQVDISRPLDLVFRAQYAKPAAPVTIKKVTLRAL